MYKPLFGSDLLSIQFTPKYIVEKSLVWKIKGSYDLRLSSETSELPDTICFIGLDDMEIFSHAITAWGFFPRLQLKGLFL